MISKKDLDEAKLELYDELVRVRKELKEDIKSGNNEVISKIEILTDEVTRALDSYVDHEKRIAALELIRS